MPSITGVVGRRGGEPRASGRSVAGRPRQTGWQWPRPSLIRCSCNSNLSLAPEMALNRPVADAQAERPLSVQLADPRRDAREWARRAESGHFQAVLTGRVKLQA